MLSHARVSRRLSRKGSHANNHHPGSTLSPAITGDKASLYSQPITFLEGELLNINSNDCNDTTNPNSRSLSPASLNYKSSTEGLYFKTLDELTDWYINYEELANDNLFDQFRIPRQDLNLYKRSRPRSGNVNLSVCHDFKGNYLHNEDLNPSGYFPHPNGLHYFLQFPSLVNHFIYFSHHFISVPTVSWINNCHKLGIACLGTIIVEGNTTDKFKQLSQLCVKNQNHEFIYIKMLVKLFEHYKFDGFLVNVETRFLNHSESFEIVNFVEQLKASLHAISSNSKVIWYDSFVPSLNKVKYENGVAPSNYELFKASDYFLSNYWWDEDSLKKNVAIAGLHGINSSLYVGIDMWGRGSKIGNGGFDAPIAINFCKAYDSNVCLFAPAWTYEFLGQDSFLENDKKLWKNDGDSDTVSTFVDSYSACCFFPYANHYNSPSKKHSFVFYTNFSNGQGKLFAINGKNAFNNYWVNSNFQHEIPDIVFENNYKKNYNFLDISIDNDEAYIGGSSLKITKNDSQLILNDGDSIEDINKELLKGKRLFKFGNICQAENLKVKLTYKYNIINKNFQLNGNIESDKESELFNSKINSLNDLVDGYFQIELKYKIERRYKNVHKVSDGSLKIPLDIGKSDIKNSFYETDWKTAEMKFPTPKGIKWEHCIFSSVDISWVNNRFDNKQIFSGSFDSGIFSNVYKLHRDDESNVSLNPRYIDDLENETDLDEEGDDEDDEWIVLPDNSTPTSLTELFIGDLSICSILDEDVSSLPSIKNKISSLEQTKSLNQNSYFIKWIDFNNNNLTKASYWNIFINDEFVGVSHFNYWAIDLKKLMLTETSKKFKNLKVRIDTVSIIGDIIPGDDIFVKL